MTDTVSFAVSESETAVILQIVQRYEAMRVRYGLPAWDGEQRLSSEMDVTACHCNGCPLRLEELLAADDFNFMHDMAGIRNHIDRETGKLMDHFLPRFSRPQEH